MPLFKDLTGKRFNNVIVIKHEGFNRRGASLWKYRCDCGKESTCNISTIKRIKSCGCERIKSVIKIVTKHGMNGTKEHRIWKGIKQRCNNPNDTGYKDYGGRGIKICDRWNESFENFYKDMGKCSKDCDGIDRIDNDGNYDPKNCKWASNFENNQHRRDSFMIPYKGKVYNCAALSRKLNIPHNTLRYRHERGLQIDIRHQGRLKNANNQQQNR